MKVREAIEEREEQLVDLLQTMLSIDTTNPPGHGYPEMVELLEPMLQDLGYETRILEVPDEIVKKKSSALADGPRPNILARKDNGHDETVTVYAHMDTVPVEEPWSFDPLKGTRRDGKIYGRGAADMKGAIATLLTALAVIEEEGLDERYNVDVTLVTDEELYYSGVCFMVDEDLVRGHILCLEGGLRSLTVAINGFMSYSVSVKGKSVHSGRSYLGVNALEEAVPILEELLELKKEVDSRRSSYEATVYSDEDYIRPVLNITMFRGGQKVNIVPSAAVIQGDRRYIPEEDPAEVEAEIGEAVARGAGGSKAIDISFDIKRGYRPVVTPTDSPRVGRMKRVMEAVLDQDVPLVGEQGSSDMGYVQAVTDKEVLSFGPGRTCSNPHGADEHVHVEDLLRHAEILVRYITED